MKTSATAPRGINKFGLALVLAAATVVFTQSAFTQTQASGAYRYSPSMAQQDWNSPGLDQDPANYSLIGSGPVDCQNTEKICSYDLVDGQFVQNSKGTLQ